MGLLDTKVQRHDLISSVGLNEKMSAFNRKIEALSNRLALLGNQQTLALEIGASQYLEAQAAGMSMLWSKVVQNAQDLSTPLSLLYRSAYETLRTDETKAEIIIQRAEAGQWWLRPESSLAAIPRYKDPSGTWRSHPGIKVRVGATREETTQELDLGHPFYAALDGGLTQEGGYATVGLISTPYKHSIWVYIPFDPIATSGVNRIEAVPMTGTVVERIVLLQPDNAIVPVPYSGGNLYAPMIPLMAEVHAMGMYLQLRSAGGIAGMRSINAFRDQVPNSSGTLTFTWTPPAGFLLNKLTRVATAYVGSGENIRIVIRAMAAGPIIYDSEDYTNGLNQGGLAIEPGDEDELLVYLSMSADLSKQVAVSSLLLFGELSEI